jgi:hypothetical protein
MDEMQDEDGQWVPAIPVPFYGLIFKRCACGDRFWTVARYRRHYRAHQ